jgi:hypothetical protein
MDSAGAPSGQAAGALQADDLSDEAVAAMFRKLLADVDRTLVRFMASWGITLLRVALGIVFLWFGALKLVGRSPVADLVAQTVYWIPPAVVVPVLGVWEVVVGLGLLAGVALRVVLFLFWLQMAGTFLVLVVRLSVRQPPVVDGPRGVRHKEPGVDCRRAGDRQYRGPAARDTPLILPRAH